MIYERLMENRNSFKDTNREHLEYFGAAGLRTLCLAYKDLNSGVYESWNEKFIQAKSALRDREKKLDEVVAYFFLTNIFTCWVDDMWRSLFAPFDISLHMHLFVCE